MAFNAAERLNIEQILSREGYVFSDHLPSIHTKEARDFAEASRYSASALTPEGLGGLRKTLDSSIEPVVNEVDPLFSLPLGYASIFYERQMNGVVVNEADAIWSRNNPVHVNAGERKITRTIHYGNALSFVSALVSMQQTGQRIVDHADGIDVPDWEREADNTISFSATSICQYLGGTLYGGRYEEEGQGRVMFSIPLRNNDMDEETRNKHDLAKFVVSRLQSDTRSPRDAARFYTIEQNGEEFIFIDVRAELLDPAYNTSYSGDKLKLPDAVYLEKLNGINLHTDESAEVMVQLGGFEAVADMGMPEHHIELHNRMKNAAQKHEGLTPLQFHTLIGTMEEKRRLRRELSPEQREKITKFYLGAWAHRLLNMFTFEGGAMDAEEAGNSEMLYHLADNTLTVELAQNIDVEIDALLGKGMEYLQIRRPTVELQARYVALYQQLYDTLTKRTKFVPGKYGLADESANNFMTATRLLINQMEEEMYEAGIDMDKAPPIAYRHLKLLLRTDLMERYNEVVREKAWLLSFIKTQKAEKSSEFVAMLEGTLRRLYGGINLGSLEVMDATRIDGYLEEVMDSFEGKDLKVEKSGFGGLPAIESMPPVLSRWVEVVMHNITKYGEKDEDGKAHARVTGSEETIDGKRFVTVRVINKGNKVKREFEKEVTKAREISLQKEEPTKSADEQHGHGMGTMLVRVLVDAMYSQPNTWNPEQASQYCFYEVVKTGETDDMVQYDYVSTIRLPVSV